MDQIATLLARVSDLRNLAHVSTDPAVREELLAIAAELEAIAQRTSSGDSTGSSPRGEPARARPVHLPSPRARRGAAANEKA